MNGDGTGVAQLTSDPAADVDPAFSPAGDRLAFVSDRSGNQEIYTMNLDGTGLRRITTHPATDRDPAWSTDGTRLAFETFRDGDWDIYVVNADGTGLFNFSAPPGSYDVDAHELDPTWHWSGKYIGYTTNRWSGWPITQHYRIELHHLPTITSSSGHNIATSEPLSASVFNPSWRQGAEYPVSEMPDGTDWEIVGGLSAANRLSDHPGVDVEPEWSPDGREIAFTTYRHGHPEIYVMNADGSGQRRLTWNRTYDADPTWQPVQWSPPPVCCR